MNILELIDKTQDENSNNVNNSDNDLVIDHIENTTTETETTTEEIDSTSANNSNFEKLYINFRLEIKLILFFQMIIIIASIHHQMMKLTI